MNPNGNVSVWQPFPRNVFTGHMHDMALALPALLLLIHAGITFFNVMYLSRRRWQEGKSSLWGLLLHRGRPWSGRRMSTRNFLFVVGGILAATPVVMVLIVWLAEY